MDGACEPDSASPMPGKCGRYPSPHRCDVRELEDSSLLIGRSFVRIDDRSVSNPKTAQKQGAWAISRPAGKLFGHRGPAHVENRPYRISRLNRECWLLRMMRGGCEQAGMGRAGINGEGLHA